MDHEKPPVDKVAVRSVIDPCRWYSCSKPTGVLLFAAAFVIVFGLLEMMCPALQTWGHVLKH